jgi:hypothetical protein
MNRYRTWVLTDIASDVWLDTFVTSSDRVPLGAIPLSASGRGAGGEGPPRGTLPDWSIRKRTLHGGLRDGIDLIEVHNGALSYAILPTRGMGLWQGHYHGHFLGWRAPVHGPVHPKFVNTADRGGLGWLAGFDEWLVRCGLGFNGPPGEDVWTDKAGAEHRCPVTLQARLLRRGPRRPRAAL